MHSDSLQSLPVGEILDYAEAIEEARSSNDELSILLGNGFSIDYSPRTFVYSSLAAEAELRDLSVAKEELFKSLNTDNFELIIEKLRAAASLQGPYGFGATIARKMESDARVVRNGLADVLAARHPDNSNVLTLNEVEHARTFLSPFGEIFTLSYDLLLYWVVNAVDESSVDVPRADGFEWPTFKSRGKLIWKRRPSKKQRIHFLHGALHLFSAEMEGKSILTKLAWAQRGNLIDALRSELAEGKYPLVVTEGTHEEKVQRIDRSLYLRTAHRRFGDLNGALFIHGTSLSANDDHVLERVESEGCEVKALFVGVHGDPRSSNARSVMERARLIKERRESAGFHQLDLHFYDTATAHVWHD
jgi:hypothetical protein